MQKLRKGKEIIKSQDDLNQPETHSTEVLLSTLEELERVKKQLAIAVRKLDVAKELLSAGRPMVYMALEHIEYALERIEALDKIKELEK